MEMLHSVIQTVPVAFGCGTFFEPHPSPFPLMMACFTRLIAALSGAVGLLPDVGERKRSVKERGGGGRGEAEGTPVAAVLVGS